jgi:hypothetical protein
MKQLVGTMGSTGTIAEIMVAAPAQTGKYLPNSTWKFLPSFAT